MKNNLDAETIKKLIELGIIDEKELEEKLKTQTDNIDLIIPYLYKDYMLEIKKFGYGTRNTYRYAINSFFSFLYKEDDIKNVFDLYGKNKAKQITQKDIEDWIEFLDDKVTQTTKRIYKTALSQFFNYVNNKHYGYFPNIDSIKITVEDKNILDMAITEEEVLGIARSTDKKQDELLITMIYQLGLKRVEVRNIKESDIDIENGYINICKENGDLDRKGELTSELSKLIKDFLIEKTDTINETNDTRKRRSYRTGEAYSPIERSKYLFQTYKHANDERINPATINRILSKAVIEYYTNKYASLHKDKAELKKVVEEKEKTITTETLRNSRRVKLLADGVPESKVMAIMGDTNVTFTRRYIKVAQVLYPENFKY